VAAAARRLFALFHGAASILTIARHAAAGDLRPAEYGYRLGIIGAPARMA
jgi:hypothetical protein